MPPAAEPVDPCWVAGRAPALVHQDPCVDPMKWQPIDPKRREMRCHRPLGPSLVDLRAPQIDLDEALGKLLRGLRSPGHQSRTARQARDGSYSRCRLTSHAPA